MTFHAPASEVTLVHAKLDDDVTLGIVLHTSACGAAVLHASAYGATNDDDVTLGSRAPCFSPWSSQTNVLHVSACGAAMLRAPVSGALKDDVIIDCEY